MSHIRDAVDMWALDTGSSTGATPQKTDIVTGYLIKWPKCIFAEYDMPAVGSNPTCPNQIAGHTLDDGATSSGGDGHHPPSPSPSQ